MNLPKILFSLTALIGICILSTFGTPNLSAAALTCRGEVINAETIDDVSAYLSRGTDSSQMWVVKKLLQMNDEGNPLAEFADALPGEIERRIEAINSYELSGFSEKAAKQIAARIGSNDMCAAGYSCGASNATNSGQCSGCGFDEITPRTNPRTCNYSCRMCCAHFATPATATCLNSCISGDPC